MDRIFKLDFSEAIKSAPVLNLSSYAINQDEISLLAKGLNFIPKTSKSYDNEVEEALKEFKRRLKLIYLFHPQKEEKEIKKFYNKSNFDPPDPIIDKDLLNELDKLSEEVKHIKLGQNSSNLSPKEIKAISSLKKNTNIIIKPADKGSCTVILDKVDYIKEGIRQLSNDKHYKKIEEPIHPKIKDKISTILNELYLEGYLDKKQVDYLKVPEKPRERRFYLLPKIHKEKSKWLDNEKIPPGRPIVSDCNSDTYRIAEYIDSFLSPLATSHSSFIKDTSDFLHKLSKIRPNKDSLLITIDVDSLYTNIDNRDGLKSVKKIFEINQNERRPDNQLLELLKLSLENNDFMFNNEWYLQTWGTAMGKKFAPNYANIFLADWEQEALKKCPKLPDCYFRYLDDIFIVWSHGTDEFKKFFDILNNHHPTIKLKASIDSNSIDFLDVTIFKGQRFSKTNKLDTKVFFKPTDTHQLLHKSSYHPKHTFKGLVKSQVIRFHRICNNKTDFDNACTILFSSLKHRGYSARFLRTLKNDAIQVLKPNAQSKKCRQPNCKTCPHLMETTSITTTDNKVIHVKDSLNCQTEGLVYAIQCSNCNIIYVGETSRTLHDRLTQHRSSINTKKDTQVAIHFNEACPDINYLKIIPLESVPRQIRNTFMDLTAKEDLLRLLRKEQYWIKKLNSFAPIGLNKRCEVPPPVPFIMKFNDQSGKINNNVKQFYDKLAFDNYGIYRKYQLVTAHKRNKNIKDQLVSSVIKC